MGCHFLLQGIFPIQGSNPGLWHLRQILDRLCHQGSPTMYTYIVSVPPSPSHPSGSSQSSRLSSLCYPAAPHLLSVLHTVAYVCQRSSLNLSHPLLPQLCSQVHSLCLCLYSCPTNRFISTVFSRFYIYICVCVLIYVICFFLSDSLHSV